MKFLVQFKSVPNLIDFCLPELKSIIRMFQLDCFVVFMPNFNITKQSNPIPTVASEIRHTSFESFPFIFLELPSMEIAQQIVHRSILIDVIIELISNAESYDELVNSANYKILEKYNNNESKISFEIDPFNSHLSQNQIIQIIEFVTESFKIKGKIDIKNSQIKFWIMEKHVHPYTKQTDCSIISTLLDIFFGVEIARSKTSFRVGSKDNFLFQYDLKNRVYLGPTTTDHTLAFLMANQAEVQSGNMIFDPFVGSGSLLIPPSHYGAICLGGDLDPRVLHGFGVGKINKKSTFYQSNMEYCDLFKPKIMLNFEQYNLPKPQILRMDCVNTNFRKTEIFSAIICDPPYGLRAMTRIQGKKKQVNEENQTVEGDEVEELKANQEICPTNSEQTKQNTKKFTYQHKQSQTINVPVDNIVDGLFNLADRILIPGGLLVFLYPIDRQQYKERSVSNLNHSNFELVDYSENILTLNKSRVLVTFKKKEKNTV